MVDKLTPYAFISYKNGKMQYHKAISFERNGVNIFGEDTFIFSDLVNKGQFIEIPKKFFPTRNWCEGDDYYTETVITGG